ncbi:related to secreted aspartic protease (barrierpepsin precursor) [Cephalotrichum gorgonifer]|uniref:Related to secreted aspartic protease (Barrierpepsin) n=1 Tax=Cephalotrichum gorgonifer TaxID=2041049 RepID=A0AAE8SVS0_9PEZI|nr:related to secreted aspartic protease (barrierpepsin precursor) [Cephalotrichum gorgonifer]
MVSSPLLLLALAACAQSWPQLFSGSGLLRRDLNTPTIPFTSGGNVSPRQFPVEEDLGIGLATLPVPNKAPKAISRSRRQFPVEEDLGMDLVTLPILNKAPSKAGRKSRRQFPVDEDIDMSLVTLLVRNKPSNLGRRSRREFPVEDLDMSAVTLPVPPQGRDIRAGGEKAARREEVGQTTVDEEDGPGALTLSVVHSTKPGVFKRAIEVQLANRSDVAYYAQLNLGTPPQPVFVQLDTGSFELWVNPDCTTLPDRDLAFCEAVGRYETSASQTVSALSENSTLRYGIGAANVTYVKDNIALPGSRATLRDVKFGVATSTEDQFAGILGLGHGHGVTTNYKNFLDELVNQNVTRTKAFSLGLGSKNDQEGVVVFGGVDTAKFSGGLAPVPIIPAADSPDEVPRYWVQLEGVSLTPPGGDPGAAGKPYPGSRTPVFLDSGATLTLLPPALAGAIAADFGSPGEDANGFYPVDCGLVGSGGTLNFEFRGVTIRVQYGEMIRELRNPPSCYLGIIPSEDFILLGDTFLRSAYVVFDPDDSMTYMSQYKNCGSQVRSLASSDEIPALYGLCGLTENSVLPWEENNRASGPGEAAAETGGAARRVGGTWAGILLVVAWWLV